tara:strand:+ start:365 stop:535 length:171 start_codon:yes stop_codon:yes gene_type:complete
MNIKSAKYMTDNGENCSISVVIEDKKYSVPLDTTNRHYQEILEWAKIDGNIIEDAD